MNRFEWVFLYWLPPVFILFLIFYASFQPASEQDISHILTRMTDRDYLIGQGREFMGFWADISLVFRGLFMEQVWVSVLVSAAVMLFIVMFFRSTFTEQRTLRVKMIRVVLMILFLMILSVMILFLFASETMVSVISSLGPDQWVVAFMNWVDFEYAGRQVNLEQYGAVGLLNFLFRKTAHFVLYALLAFFLFRAIFVFSRRRMASFFIALVLVVLTGSLDEYQQSMNPGRSGLIEDVILDSVGGLFGASLALLMSPLMKHVNRATAVRRTS